jgi:hypothetical protein
MKDVKMESQGKFVRAKAGSQPAGLDVNQLFAVCLSSSKTHLKNQNRYRHA